MVEKQAKIYIGTSGWHYKHWVGKFYPAKMKQEAFTQYYLQYFDTVEINNSFYRLPSIDTFTQWKNAVPAHFIFAVKGSRFITHMKKLSDPRNSLQNFLHHAGALEEKLGPILFQLPPMWKLNLLRLEAFIRELPPYLRYTFEFRNHTWYQPEVLDLLRAYNIAFCIYEIEYHLSPMEVTADFVYIRLHGPGTKYDGSYNDETLSHWALLSKQWLAEGKDVYIYFDNDMHAYAPFNALRLKELTGG